ncbi:MAG: hypothetical protein ACLPID_04790 [Beijerinckiaceae bacterium]
MGLFRTLTQEYIVFGLAVALFVVFSVSLPGFLSSENILTLVRNAFVFGILSVAMALAALGRGGVLTTIVGTLLIGTMSFPGMFGWQKRRLVLPGPWLNGSSLSAEPSSVSTDA